MYEQSRGDRRKPIEMFMTSMHRENILQKLGFSKKDRDWGIKAANIARQKQRKTHANLHASDTHEWLEALRNIDTEKSGVSDRQFAPNSR
jgi:hypothetical protein